MSALDWLVANPAYGFAGAVGLCIGIFYGFDGWRGDTTNLTLQDSPRVKNLLWVLGPGVVALVGDVKALDPDAKKSLLMLSYFVPCVIAGIFIVLLWGFVVACSRIAALRNHKDYGYGLGDSLGDYFFYGYRYYRTRLDEARARAMSPANLPPAPLKIALFLDVDLTITEEIIQSVYARELGLKDEYEKKEREYQNKTITSAQFGKWLIASFAAKGFTKAKAAELFGSIDLKNWVDPLFTLQEKGVAIYLVSAGPNYYIEALAADKKIPKERVLCSHYYFEAGDLISRCDAIEDDQKTNFVLNERRKFDITIGIGDSDQHDRFVSVCTIAMLTSVHTNYFHVPHFNAVFLLIQKLLEPRRTTVAEPKPAALPTAKAGGA